MSHAHRPAPRTRRTLLIGLLLFSCGRFSADTNRSTPAQLQRAETQAQRDAKVTNLAIAPANVTIRLGQQLVFTATAYDAGNNPVGGVNVTWTASLGGASASVSPTGVFAPSALGVYTIVASGAGTQAQTSVTVIDGSTFTGAILSSSPFSWNDGTPPGSLSTWVDGEPGWDRTVARAVFRRWNQRGADARYECGRNCTGGPAGVSRPAGNQSDDFEGQPSDAKSGNYQFTVPILSLPGRTLDVNLALNYNATLWSSSSDGTTMLFDVDADWPAPGFSFGLGGKCIGTPSGPMLIDVNGTRHKFAGTVDFHIGGGRRYNGHTEDGTFIDYIVDVFPDGSYAYCEAFYPDGTDVKFAVPGPAGLFHSRSLYPSKITAASGNSIWISYQSISGYQLGPRITGILDSMGRVISFWYDTNNLLTAITAPGLQGGPQRTVARFNYYQLPAIGNPFSSFQVDVRNPRPWMLDYIYFPGTQTGYAFAYISYGVVNNFIQESGMSLTPPDAPLTVQGTINPGNQTRARVYFYPTAPLSTAPMYNQMTELWRGGGPNSTTSYEFTQTPNDFTIKTTFPDGHHSWQTFISDVDTYGVALFDDGLLKETKTDANNAATGDVLGTVTAWEIDTNNPYNYNSPRPSAVRIYNREGVVKTVATTYGARYNQPATIIEYEGNGATELRRTEYVYQVGAELDTYTQLLVHVLSLPKEIHIGVGAGAANRQSFTAYSYDEGGQWLCLGHFPMEHSAFANITTITTCSNATVDSITDPNCAPVTETRNYYETGLLHKSSLGAQDQEFIYTSDTQCSKPQNYIVGRGAVTISTQADWDFNTSLQLTSYDANGNLTQFNYDAASLRVNEIDYPTGAWTQFAYDDSAISVLTSTWLTKTDPLPRQTKQALNGLGLVWVDEKLADTKLDIPSGGVVDVVEYRYDVTGRLSQRTQPYRFGTTPQWDVFTYDGLGRPLSVSANGRSIQYLYNEWDSAASRLRRPDSASARPGNTVRIIDGSTDGSNPDRWRRMDALGRLAEVAEPSGNALSVYSSSTGSSVATAYTYNALDNVVEIDDVVPPQAPVQQRKFAYDGLRRLIRQRLPERNAKLNDLGQYVSSGGLWSDVFIYDARSRLISYRDARGVRTNYDYGSGSGDALDRLQGITYDTSFVPDPTSLDSPDPVFLTYTATGDITRPSVVGTGPFSNPTASDSYGYDVLGRLASKSSQLSARPVLEVDYAYNNLDQVTDVTYPNAYGLPLDPRRTAHYDYDVQGRIQLVTLDGVAYASDLAYNPASQLINATLPAGQANGQPALYETYRYSTIYLAEQWLSQGATQLLHLGYANDYPNSTPPRDSQGQLTRLTNYLNDSGSRWYDYNGRYGIRTVQQAASSPAWSIGYQYDRYGNRLTSTPSGPVPAQDGFPTLAYAAGTNRITSASFDYDDAGNQTKAPRNDGGWNRYRYDAKGRLVQVLFDNGVGQTVLESYRYGLGNQRLVTATPNDKTYYVWDGDRVLAEYKDGAVVTGPQPYQWSRSFLYMGSRLLATLIREDSGSEGVRYQHPGRVGTRVITDPMRSASFEQTTMPFGNVDSATSSDHPFSDYMRSAATGLDYAVNRWYDKSQGRFTTTDPISTGATSLRNPQSLNLYAYVGNDALNARDPSGLSPIELPPFPPDPGSGDVIEPEPPGDPGGGTPPASPPSSPVPPVPDRQTPRPPMQCGRSPRTGAAGLTFDASWDGQSDEQEMLDRAYNILSNFGPVNDWFQRNWDRDIFATPHRVEFQERSRFWGENANSTTNSHNGTMTFYASAFGNLNDLTASLMHELNNVAARYLAFYYDTPFLGGRGPKGSYTAETVAHQAYEAQCTATSP